MIFLSSLLPLLADIPPDLPVAPESTLPSERFEFSQEMGEYFQEELSLPQEPLSPEQKQEIAGKAKPQILASYLENGAWRISITFPYPLEYQETFQNGSLYLIFNQPIDSTDLAKVQEKLSYLLKGLFNGYNTLYLVPERASIFSVKQQEQTLYIDICPDYEADAPTSFSLELAYARLCIEERDYKRAECVIDQLLKKYPQDKDVLLLQTELLGIQQKPQQQIWQLKELSSQYPWDDDVQTLYYDAYTPHSSYLSTGWQLQKTINYATIWLFPFEMEAILSQNSSRTIYLGADYQFWRGKLKSIVNNQGLPTSFFGNRYQADLFLRSAWTQGQSMKATLYEQETGVFGAGVEGSWLFPALQGRCTLNLDWHRPCWEVFEAFAYHGREDIATFRIDATVNRYLQWSLGSGGRRVGITGVPNGYTSILFEGELFLYCTTTNPSFALNYGIDAEYVRHHAVKIGVDGLPYQPVPLTSFEDHSFRAYLFYTLRNRLYLTLFAGETFNRLGTNDSTYGIDMKYIKPCPHGLEFTLSAYKFPSITVQGAQAIYVTLSLTGRY